MTEREFAEVAEQLRPALIDRAAKEIGRDAAQEVVQGAIVRSLGNCAVIEKAKAPAYLGVAIANRIIDYRRGQQRRKAHEVVLLEEAVGGASDLPVELKLLLTTRELLIAELMVEGETEMSISERIGWGYKDVREVAISCAAKLKLQLAS